MGDEDAEKLRALAGQLRLENDRLRGTKTRVREAELTSDVEQLRAQVVGTMEQLRLQERLTAKESAGRATANALLKRWVNAPAIAQDEYLSGRADMNLGLDTLAHLAAQAGADWLLPGVQAMSDEKAFPEPVIVPLDELMAKLALVSLDVVRKVLATQALYVVGPAEKAVLDRMGDVPTWALENNDSDDYYCPQEMRLPIQAELIRRGIR